MVTSGALSELRFRNSGAWTEGGLVLTVALPRCPVAASSANWQEREVVGGNTSANLRINKTAFKQPPKCVQTMK